MFRLFLTISIVFCSLFLLSKGNVRADDGRGPVVAVLINPKSPKLESYAAEELSRYLGKLFAVKATPAGELPQDADALLVVGSPKTNPSVAKALGADGWPKVSDQGIVIKRGQLAGKPVLVVGGGSPKATLWAVYELVERWGVRYLLHGDVLPEAPGKFRLPKGDLVLEPKLRVRQWRVINDFACGPEAWGMEDYGPVLDQLAKMKFNRIYLSIYAWQPFLHLEHKGIARKSAFLWYKFRYPITDDMIGRELFDDRAEFWNPDLPLGASYAEFSAAGEKLVHRLMEHAHQRGIESVMHVTLTDFPPEFGALPGDWKPIHQLSSMTIVPGPATKPDDPVLTELATAVLQTAVNTYPEVDMVCLGMPEFRQWGALYKEAWKALDDRYGISEVQSLDDILQNTKNRASDLTGGDRAVQELTGDIVNLRFYDRLIRERNALAGTKRPDMKIMYRCISEEMFPVLSRILPPGSETLNAIDYTPSRVLKRREVIGNLDAKEVPAILTFTLHDDNVGVLPQLSTGSLHELTKDIRKHGWAGFSTRYWITSDHDPCVSYIARAAWDAEATPEAVYRDQVRAACGEAAVEDMLQMFRELEKTTIFLEWNAMGLTFPVPGIIMRQWGASPMPDAYVEARAGYRRALEAARRAREKSTERGYGYIDYWIGRLEFGAGYFDTIEAVRRAAAVEKAGDWAKAAKAAEEALATARGALGAYARVARDRSDYGTLAVLNQYVYRPLQHKVAELKKK